MTNILFPIAMIFAYFVVYWIRHNGKIIWEIEWSPFQWWLYIGLFTTYLVLMARWKLVSILGAWQVSLVCYVIGFIVEMILNSVYYGFNLKSCVSMTLILIAMLIQMGCK